jgi:hypothetical protein
MGFQLLSKTNMGVAATLFLVILLSQSRVFDFLFVTALGRAILILFILGISYTNHILGVVSVLLIIIMFNQSNIGYMEGFTSDSYTSKESDTKIKPKVDNVKQNIATISSSVSSVPTQTSLPKETFVAREGFNVVDRESAMLRGKNSNQIPVFASVREQNEDIEPSDKSVFSGIFSSF